MSSELIPGVHRQQLPVHTASYPRRHFHLLFSGEKSPLSSIINRIYIYVYIYIYMYIYIYSLLSRQPPSGSWPSSVTRFYFFEITHNDTPQSSHRPLPNNTQHSQQRDIHAPRGIRTHDLSRRAAVDLRLRPRGHWDRHIYEYIYIYNCTV